MAERREQGRFVRWRWRRVMAAPMADQKAAEDTEAPAHLRPSHKSQHTHTPDCQISHTRHPARQAQRALLRHCRSRSRRRPCPPAGSVVRMTCRGICTAHGHAIPLPARSCHAHRPSPPRSPASDSDRRPPYTRTAALTAMTVCGGGGRDGRRARLVRAMFQQLDHYVENSASCTLDVQQRPTPRPTQVERTDREPTPFLRRPPRQL